MCTPVYLSSVRLLPRRSSLPAVTIWAKGVAVLPGAAAMLDQVLLDEYPNCSRERWVLNIPTVFCNRTILQMYRWSSLAVPSFSPVPWVIGPR
jgi:hypothetical protein